jgi:hypothetical protein
VAANTYEIGDLVRLSVEFRIGATLTNPSAVTLQVKNPLGAVTTPAVVNDSTGKYHGDVTLDKAGTWTYRFAGTGAVQKAGRGALNVAASEFD